MVEESIRSHWHFESIAQDARKKGGWRVQRAELEGWLHRAEPVGRMTERWRTGDYKEHGQQNSAARCVRV